MTVLGKAKWTMSFTHFVLLFAIFHALVKHTVKSRYISTVLPVHRLFFVVICWIDGMLFVTFSNVTTLIDSWAVAVIFLILVTISADTPVILASLKAVKGSRAPLFSTPWRNGAVVGMLVVTALYTLVSQYLGRQYTWEAVSHLGLTLLSLLLLLLSLWDTVRHKGEGGAVALDQLVNFFLCVSGSNVLGLFSVTALLHRLALRTEFDSF